MEYWPLLLGFDFEIPLFISKMLVFLENLCFFSSLFWFCPFLHNLFHCCLHVEDTLRQCLWDPEFSLSLHSTLPCSSLWPMAPLPSVNSPLPVRRSWFPGALSAPTEAHCVPPTVTALGSTVPSLACAQFSAVSRIVGLSQLTWVWTFLCWAILGFNDLPRC